MDNLPDLFSLLANEPYEPTKYGSGSTSFELDTVRENDSAPSEYQSRSSNLDPGRDAIKHFYIFFL